MLQNIDSRTLGVIVIETLPARSTAPMGPALDRDATLAEFLAQLTGSDGTQRNLDSQPAPAARTGHAMRPPAWSRRGPRATVMFGATRLSADLPSLAAELETSLRQVQRRISQAVRAAR